MARGVGRQLVHSLVLVSCCMAALQARAAELAPADQRMVAVAKLWRDVKWLHPALARGDVDWDAALVASLPTIQAARTPDELKLALAELMAPLHDPALRFDAEPPAVMAAVDPAQPVLEWLDGDVALLHLHGGRGPEDQALAAPVRAVFARARALIIDTRPAAYGTKPLELNTVAARLIDKPLWLPAVRVRSHDGYEPQGAPTSGGYRSGWHTLETTRLAPSPDARPMPTAFVVNNQRPVPAAVLALQRAGKAFIVAQGMPSPSWVVPPLRAQIDASTFVQFSRAEMIFEDGSSGFGADAVLPIDAATGADSAAVRAALALLRSGRTPGAGVSYARPPLLAAKQVEPLYPAMAFPDLAWRQLAVIKLWAIADAFFPYKQYMDAPWIDALPVSLRQVAAARDAREYALAMAHMANQLGDNHVFLTNPEIAQVLGWFSPGIHLVRADGRIAVAGFASEELARSSGLQAGDVVVSVDGEEAGPRLARLGAVTGGSREEMKQYRALAYLLKAPKPAAAVLRVEDAAGRQREVSVARKVWPAAPSRQGPVVKLLAGNVGYVDLERLETADIDAMFDKVQGTGALILDMRGYPRGVAPALGQRLNVRGATVAAQFRRPQLSALDRYAMTAGFDQPMPPGATKSIYKGRLVMLIDARTISQAEHTALLVEAAAPVTFIGSHSAGANGDITGTYLPGNIRVNFSGQEVLHGDGRRLQRIGIAPDIAVAPTLAGLRAGRDEVLERALQFIETGK